MMITLVWLILYDLVSMWYMGFQSRYVEGKMGYWSSSEGSVQPFYSPPNREDNRSITGYDNFPLLFCSHRWIEGKKIADRALKM